MRRTCAFGGCRSAADLEARADRYAIFSAIYPPHARELVQALRRQRYLNAHVYSRWFDNADGDLYECHRLLSPGELDELLDLAWHWTDNIQWDCVGAVGHSSYSYIFQAPFSLEAIWWVRDARLIYLDELDEADAALGLDP